MIDVISRKALLKEIECGIKAGNYEEGYEHYGRINDSDGVYRRGVRAESKCPINNVSVNHGLGYCYMFEPQESEDKECI